MKIKKDTVIRTILLIIALINQLLVSNGLNTLPFTDDQITEVLTMILTTGTALWAWWKNNSFTNKAKAADAYLDKLRKE